MAPHFCVNPLPSIGYISRRKNQFWLDGKDGRDTLQVVWPPSATLEGGTRWRQVICAANDAGYSGRDGVKEWPAEGGHDGTEPSGRVSPSIGIEAPSAYKSIKKFVFKNRSCIIAVEGGIGNRSLRPCPLKPSSSNTTPPMEWLFSLGNSLFGLLL